MMQNSVNFWMNLQDLLGKSQQVAIYFRRNRFAMHHFLQNTYFGHRSRNFNLKILKFKERQKTNVKQQLSYIAYCAAKNIDIDNVTDSIDSLYRCFKIHCSSAKVNC